MGKPLEAFLRRTGIEQRHETGDGFFQVGALRYELFHGSHRSAVHAGKPFLVLTERGIEVLHDFVDQTTPVSILCGPRGHTQSEEPSTRDTGTTIQHRKDHGGNETEKNLGKCER